MKILYVFFLSVGLLGCSNDKPKPETLANIQVIPMNIVQVQKSDNVIETMKQEKNEQWFIKHHIKGNNVYIECFIPNYSFKNSTQNDNKLRLYVDNQKLDDITTAAFVIKGLTSGKHTIKLELVHSVSNEKKDMKQFDVYIKPQ